MKHAIENARQVCLFGVGALLMECYGQLVLALGREPDVLCDNASGKWGEVFFKKRCVSPAELAEQRDGTVVIIAVRKYEDIYQQLCKLGISNIFVACFDSGYHALRGINKLDNDQLTAHNEDQDHSSVDQRGRWTLVTGASRGIGRQIALAMARLGSNIIAHSRSLNHVADVANTCREHGVQVVPISAELANLDEIEAMLFQLEQTVPPIDIVFNNAAIASPLPWPSDIWSVPNSTYRDSFTVNAIAPALICQKLIPPMIKRGFGRVVNIHTNLNHLPEEIAYVCSKAALDKYVHDMSPSLNDTGVMMTLADPGWVQTDAGGPKAPNAVESVLPGVLLGALLDCSFNGCRFSAQDYAGLTLEAAVWRAKNRLKQQSSTWV